MTIDEKIRSSSNLFLWNLFSKRKLKKFKNKHLGKDCFVIGNGPSLNKMDLEKLNDYHTFGMNKIYLIFKRVNLQLSYLTSVNQLVIEQSNEEFNKLKCPVFLPYQKVTNELRNNSNIYHLYTKGGISWKFSETIEKPIYEGVTVTFVALQLAYYMGFKRVFLVGVDHNFVQKGKPHEEQEMQGNDPNHFDPNYFSGQKWHLADLKGSELSYHLANYTFQREGREILDATIDGKLNIFKKIKYEKALKTANKK